MAGELACGKSASLRRNWEQLCCPYPVLPWTTEVAWHYGEIYRTLAAAGRLIGANDLWIAATAVAYNHRLVTENHNDFRRVPGLAVEAF